MKTRIFTLFFFVITCVCIAYAQNARSEVKSAASEASTDTLSCAAARELAIAGNTSNVIVKGYVTSIAVEWNSTYKNISFWLADDLIGGQVLQAYRVACANEADAPSAGDLVWVKGNLNYYNNTTPEIARGGSFGIIMKSSHIQIDGLYYKLYPDNKTAEVTYPDNYNTAWNISNANIPSTITSNGITYRVTSIGDYAFSGYTGLTSVIIGNSVTSIGNSAFFDCTSLTSVTIGNSVTSIGNDAFYRCTGLTSMIIGNSVTSIGNSAFYECTSLTSVTIGNSVTSIGEWAFSGCSGLTSVTIGNGVTSIGGRTFFGCTGLTSVTIPNSVTSIGSSAFSGCTGLTSVTIGNSVTSIGQWAFEGCTSLTSVHISDIASWCTINFPDMTSNPLYVAHNLYMNGNLITDLVIPSNVTSIGNYAFYSCDCLTSVTIPNSVTSIGDWAFGSCCDGLTSVTIPNSVTSMGDYAFASCTDLTSVTIGSSVTSIGGWAFSYCTSLTSVTCYTLVPPSLGWDVWPENLSAFYVPLQSIETYKNAQGWMDFSDIIFPIGATQTQTDNVHVEPSETSVTIVWPSVSGAETYELVIKDKSGNIICTLIFNANGQLAQIAFGAPAREQSAGFSFTVTGLEEGKSYDLTITAKNESGATLDEKSVSFSTGEAQGLENLKSAKDTHKLLLDGQILIFRGDRTYTVTGHELR